MDFRGSSSSAFTRPVKKSKTSTDEDDMPVPEPSAASAPAKQSKSWVWTKNSDWETVHDGLADQQRFIRWATVGIDEKDITYLACAMEVGDKAHRVHMHGYVQFTSNKRHSTLTKLKVFKGCWFTPAKGTAKEAVDYFKYDFDGKWNPTFLEIGDFPAPEVARALGSKKGGKKTQDIWEISRQEAKDLSVRLQDLKNAQHAICHMSGLERIRTLHQATMIASTLSWQHGSPPNLWIYGGAGTGKSRYARQIASSAYDKMADNKWWCGYAYQSDVIIDDVGRGSLTATQVKSWGDRYKFRAEYKGGDMLIRPLRIIITSNFRIAQLYPDVEDYEPIKRRYNEVTIGPNGRIQVVSEDGNVFPSSKGVAATFVVAKD